MQPPDTMLWFYAIWIARSVIFAMSMFGLYWVVMAVCEIKRTWRKK